ncbi:CAP domain-containing protein [Bacillus salitolerans]|uniref:CAP domain-containing protein n=1 Tax=Bacillus salitolerans TaxID=1437434 RepID=A0ABW4LXR2_9BACI
MKKLYALILAIMVSMNLSSATSASELSATDYKDYDATQYWAEGIKWAVNHGIMKGYSDERLLKPNHTLTEAQYLTMYFRYFIPEELHQLQNRTNNIGHWAVAQYSLAEQYHLSVSNDPLKYDQPIRRGDTALLLAEGITAKEMTEEEAIQWLYDHNLSTGYPDENGYYPKTYYSYKPNDTLTRAQGAVFLYRLLESELENEVLKVVGQEVYNFSIFGIEMYDQRAKIEEKIGEPKRITFDFQGLKLHTYYNDNYEDFMIVGYDVNDEAALLYSNQQDWFKVEKNDMPLALFHEQITSSFGDPAINYSIKNNYFMVDNLAINYFYEVHDSLIPVRALMIERFDFEGYEIPTNLFESDNYLSFDITNSYRNKFGLESVAWDDKVADTAFKHSKDMGLNKYFSHYNLLGENPGDRLQRDGLYLSSWGENIAKGYTNGIDATEGWMNSTGHRENMLRPSHTHVGIGTYFDNGVTPHYTQVFFTP